jgi:hypothetical protein
MLSCIAQLESWDECIVGWWDACGVVCHRPQKVSMSNNTMCMACWWADLLWLGELLYLLGCRTSWTLRRQ